ncbi:MAG: TetR/AcrR family transcriptional regulator [Puia sp.]|nr:TetR/AcrR family transcriptional regulator [Puia sp.]
MSFHRIFRRPTTGSLVLRSIYMSASHTIKEDIVQEQILQAAHQLFRQYGLHKVTMDDVAKAIGKGRSSLYYYYKSKEEIFDAVMDMEIAGLLTEINKGVNAVASVEQKIYAFCLAKLNAVQKRRSRYNAILTDAGMDADEISTYNRIKDSIHQRLFRQESDLLAQVLKEGIRKGELRSIDKKELDILVFVILSGLHGLKREMLSENDFSRTDAAVETFSQLIMRGLVK